MHLQYYVEGYTDSSDPAQYARLPISSIRTVSIEKMVRGQTNISLVGIDGIQRKGTHGYALCGVTAPSLSGSRGCLPGQVLADSSTLPPNRVFTSSIQGIETLDDKALADAIAELDKVEQHRRSAAAVLKKERTQRALYLEAERARIAAESEQWRGLLKVGDNSHCGLIVEFRPPIAKLQTSIGEHWLRVDQLHPPGVFTCRFLNGVYQDAKAQ